MEKDKEPLRPIIKLRGPVVERPGEPTEKEMTPAELTEKRRRDRGEKSSSESDRIMRQAMGLSETLEQPGDPDKSPVRQMFFGVRNDAAKVIRDEDRRPEPPREKRI